MQQGRPQRRRRGSAHQQDGETSREDTIVIRLPHLDSQWWQWLGEMVPGRRLLRVLQDLPEDVVTHTRNARREQLLALRSLLDAMIEDTERPRERRPPREVEIE